MKKFLILLSFLFSLHTFADEPVAIEITTPTKTQKFTLPELKAKLGSHKITINDPWYGINLPSKVKVKTYDAFLLKDVLNLAGEVSSDLDAVQMIAIDGYNVLIDLKDTQKYQGYVAYQDHGTEGKFEDIPQGDHFASPAPFYVVWKEGLEVRDTLKWPYQLAKIQFTISEEKLANAAPKNVAEDSTVAKGFKVFKVHCIACHSMNGAGGNVAPDLNYPKNVTEYFDGKIMRELIENASKVRMNNKMPAFEKILTPKEIDDVIEYLTAMKQQKLSQKAE